MVANKTTLKSVFLENRVLLLKITIHLMSLLPLVALYLLAFDDQLGADPVKEVIHFTGMGGFNLLLLSLLIMPLAKKYRQAYLLQVRRLLGLYSFTYAVCHLLSFLAFEVQFDLTLFFNEIIDRPYITVGVGAFIILLSLAFTSLNSLKRSMGKSWQKLHNWVYLAVLLIALHYFWSVKSGLFDPGMYAVITVFLLSLRREKFKRWFKK